MHKHLHNGIFLFVQILFSYSCQVAIYSFRRLNTIITAQAIKVILRMNVPQYSIHVHDTHAYIYMYVHINA